MHRFKGGGTVGNNNNNNNNNNISIYYAPCIQVKYSLCRKICYSKNLNNTIKLIYIALKQNKHVKLQLELGIRKRTIIIIIIIIILR